MSVRRGSLLLLLGALAALLAVPGAALAGGSKRYVQPAQTVAFASVKGTNGWRFQITGVTGFHSSGHPIAVYANGPHRQSVVYQGFAGRLGKDGTITAKLPGVGRIDLSYEATKAHETKLPTTKRCSVSGGEVASSGVFRGTIELHGERGYSTVSARGAKGSLDSTPRAVCRGTIGNPAKVEREVAETEEGLELKALFAVRDYLGGTLSFNALSFPIDHKGQPTEYVQMSAGYTIKRRGMSISEKTSVEPKPGAFTITTSNGLAAEATVEPPAPFDGSATFTLESPTTASWTGELGVTLPILGRVALTGPQFKPTLCENATCTKTAPGVKVDLPGILFGE